MEFHTFEAKKNGSDCRWGTTMPVQQPLQSYIGVWNEVGFQRLDRVVAACGASGIRIIAALVNFEPEGNTPAPVLLLPVINSPWMPNTVAGGSLGCLQEWT